MYLAIAGLAPVIVLGTAVGNDCSVPVHYAGLPEELDLLE